MRSAATTSRCAAPAVACRACSKVVRPSSLRGRSLITFRPPKAVNLRRLFDEHRESPFSYPEVGATRGELPSGYDVDQASVCVGRGDDAFQRARTALLGWAQFSLPWVRLSAEGKPAPGTLAAVTVCVHGLWWTNLTRVIYLEDDVDRFAFAYGTLPRHAERGEERFEVKIDRGTGEVTYSLLAFSKPQHPLARLGKFWVRRFQARFREGSCDAVRQATAATAITTR